MSYPGLAGSPNPMSAMTNSLDGEAGGRATPAVSPFWTRGWGLPSLILIASATLAIGLKPVAGEISSALIFVLGITLAGAASGLAAALATAVAAAIIFNVFVAEPVLTFRLSTGDDLAPPIIFTLCAIVSGLLAGRLRDNSRALARSNLELASLLEAARLLQAAPDAPAIGSAIATAIPKDLELGLSLFGITDEGLKPLGGGTNASRMELAKSLIAGNEAIVRQDRLSAFRLEGSGVHVGVLLADIAPRSAVSEMFLPALSNLIGLALARAKLAALVAESQATERAEELKSALLSSVSHDLRTPLTTISASASSLIAYGRKLDDKTSHEMLERIVDECDRLNRLTANLLEMSRLQAGDGGITRQLLPVGDLVRAVVARFSHRAPTRDIQVSLPREDILVMADTALRRIHVSLPRLRRISAFVIDVIRF